MTMREILSVFFSVTAICGADLQPLRNFTQPETDLKIVSSCVPARPWTVAGEYGALFGRQNGRFEAWIWPNKILSDFRIRAELANYPVPIDVNALAAEIEVTPSETVITYSHAAFTIRQHMFAARGQERSPIATAVFFDINSARPLEITFSFTPEMLHMWPAPNYGRPSGEWVAQNQSGLYILHTDDPKFSAVVAMPRTRPGTLVPYQEHPQTYPLELKLSFDPKRDAGMIFPLLMSVANAASPMETAERMSRALSETYAQTQKYYAALARDRVVIETPDPKLNQALRWAEISVDQAQVKYHDETGLVAGYYESADSARPGYAWFFGRDTLFTTYAINSYGDFALTRRALDFLLRRQRSDGKIMHEYSQSAESIDWRQTSYFYASADSTPLLVMAMRDYVRASGDMEYLKVNWPAIRKAYEFTRAHQGDDGVYNNTEGTGWVESWPPGMPHEEVYLAAIDQQSAIAMSYLARVMQEPDLSSEAKRKADEIKVKIESEFYDQGDDFYAFSRGANGSLDHTASIYSSVAWWDGTLALTKAAPMLSRWASPEFSTDWGTRDISDRASFYDPISYHQGSIWPLFTGWVSLAEYRAGRPLSAYAHLMQNVNLTWAQDLGAVTELLSGQFFQPLGRSSSHQMWSSAMVITPLLRGLFGLECDAPNHTLRLSPHLPANWDQATIKRLRLGADLFDLEYKRDGAELAVRASSEHATTLCLVPANENGDRPCTSAPAPVHTLRIALPPMEIAIPASLPQAGSVTSQLKVENEEISDRKATFTFAAPAGQIYDLAVRLNRPKISVSGAKLNRDRIHLSFDGGQGYTRRVATFSW